MKARSHINNDKDLEGNISVSCTSVDQQMEEHETWLKFYLLAATHFWKRHVLMFPKHSFSNL